MSVIITILYIVSIAFNIWTVLRITKELTIVDLFFCCFGPIVSFVFIVMFLGECKSLVIYRSKK